MKQYEKLTPGLFKADHLTNKNAHAMLLKDENITKVSIYHSGKEVYTIRKDWNIAIKELTERGYNTKMEEGMVFEYGNN